MTETSEPPAPETARVSRAGLYLALLQLVFTLGWTIYVVYLPQLAAKVGIPASWIVFVLMIDQAVFTFTDTLMGIAADKLAPIAGKLSRSLFR